MVVSTLLQVFSYSELVYIMLLDLSMNCLYHINISSGARCSHHWC